MAVTREELHKAGASPELAGILAHELRRGDLTRNPMAVVLVSAFLATFLGIMGWLVLGVITLQTDVALLKEGQTHLEEGQFRLEEGQFRLEEKVDALAADIAGIKELLGNRN